MAKEATKEVTQETDSTFGEHTTLEELVEKAPVHQIGGQPKAEEVPVEKTESPKEGEEVKEEGKEAETTDTEGESKEEVKVELPFTEEDVFKHYPVYAEYKKAYDNRESWNRTLKQKSQINKYLDGLSEEQQEILRSRTLPFVYGEEKLPDTPTELIKDVQEKVTAQLPSEIKYEDEDGIEVRIPREEYLKQFDVKGMIGNAVKMVMPDVGMMRKKLTEAGERVKELEGINMAIGIRSGEIELERLWDKHPELAPTKLRDDESIAEILDRIMIEEHPEHSLFLKLKALQTFRKENNVTIDGAYNAIYGKSAVVAKQEKEAKEQIEKNQKEVQSESPGKPTTPSEKEQIISEFGSDYETINDMFK